MPDLAIIPNDLFAFLKKWAFSNIDGDGSFTPTSATTYNFPRDIMFYRNLTIGSYATLKPYKAKRLQIIIVSGTLQLDGVIDASGYGGNPSDIGGAGGGGVLIIANKILGSGSIKANGINGGTYNPYYYSASGGGGAGVWGNGSSGNPSYNYGAGGVSPKTFFLTPIIFIEAVIRGIQDGYGGGGGGRTNGGNGSFKNITIGGGAGYLSPPDTYNTHPIYGGGGGGGLIAILSANPIPALTLQANGGNGYSTYSGAGGGGLILIIAPGDSSTKSVAGGSGYASGESGLILTYKMIPFEVI
jgi:hypothetical protein